MLPYKEMMAMPPPANEADYDAKDAILYALSVGAGDEAEEEDLPFVYEEEMRLLPTMATVIGFPGFFLKDPKYKVDWRRVLHGEQRLTLHRSLPPRASVRSELQFDEIYDKGADKGALLYSTRKIFDRESGVHYASLGSTTFLRGDGGCGGNFRSSAKPASHSGPRARRCCGSDNPEKSGASLSVVWRFNPLHADPAIAKSAGFEKPILHGLCTYGVVARVLLKHLCSNDPARFSQYDVRFSSPVYPGEKITIDIWNKSETQVLFRARVGDRGVVVLNNGYFRFDGPGGPA